MISDRVKEFIFKYIDSVEQLDVLLLLAAHKEHWWSSEAISKELRSNTSSIENRLRTMLEAGIVQQSKSEPLEYGFCPEPELESIVQDLAQIYKFSRQRVFELIFSPLKRARFFADAFNIYGSGKKNGDENG